MSIDLDPIIEQNLNDLLLLARGDYSIVEEAVKESIEKQKSKWWKSSQWVINFEKAARLVVEKNKKIESVELKNDKNSIDVD